MTRVPPRIVLFHATPVAMEPIATAMARHWPEAEAVNLLDDGLTTDRAKEGAEISEELIDRFVDFGRYAQRIGANGILITCSAFGPAIDRMVEELPLPILRPNEAMFREAIASGSRIGMLATFAPAVSSMEEEFKQFVAETGAASALDTIVVPDAIDLLRRGDATAHNRLVADMAPRFADRDAIMLAHFSTSRAAEEVRRKVNKPILTAPDAAVMRMKTLVTE
ncbi:aspartate/glutamate racemase family protein [Brucella pseudogrignonensis]|uniref:Asp/Glu/Hydantoin racemase family protein n=1 Tax=Brucella pseudogrignonensis TaxID=419475 RepID=A0A256GUV6_9HYPH|nr:aspartate/glutamate racemase family protein [Brucella pseudogrignonensis]OYR30985.1 asp/Glu/Hydantoin racemase family protein [Brucella pseudogrignonensis]